MPFRSLFSHRKAAPKLPDSVPSNSNRSRSEISDEKAPPRAPTRAKTAHSPRKSSGQPSSSSPTNVAKSMLLDSPNTLSRLPENTIPGASTSGARGLSEEIIKTPKATTSLEDRELLKEAANTRETDTANEASTPSKVTALISESASSPNGTPMTPKEVNTATAPNFPQRLNDSEPSKVAGSEETEFGPQHQWQHAGSTNRLDDTMPEFQNDPGAPVENFTQTTESLAYKPASKWVKLSSKPIFDGANGTIYKASDAANSKFVVIKCVRKQPAQSYLHYVSSVQREYDNLRKCAASKHVVEVFDLVADTKTPEPELSLIIQYFQMGDLLDYLCDVRARKIHMPTHLKDAIFKQIVKAVEFLHRHDIVHRDIKPENFLIGAGGEIKLNDFGCSLDLSRMEQQLPLSDDFCGTPSFKAPELYWIENERKRSTGGPQTTDTLLNSERESEVEVEKLDRDKKYLRLEKMLKPEKLPIVAEKEELLLKELDVLKNPEESPKAKGPPISESPEATGPNPPLSAPQTSPERCHKPQSLACGLDFKSVDVWALGIVCFQVFLMSVPWQTANIFDEKNKKMEAYMENYPEGSKQLRSLVDKLNDKNSSVMLNPALALFKKIHYDARIELLQMLNPNPNKRISCEEVLKSSWLTQAYAKPADLLELRPKRN